MTTNIHFKSEGDSTAVIDPPQSRARDGSEEERRQEEKVFADQERQADEERAQRARERLESIRQLEIQQGRSAAGLCTFCGQPLSRLLRLFRIARHSRCQRFQD